MLEIVRSFQRRTGSKKNLYRFLSSFKLQQLSIEFFSQLTERILPGKIE